MRGKLLRHRPCPVPDIFVAASALDVDLTHEPEMAWLVEFLLSCNNTLPAGWLEQGEAEDALPGDPTSSQTRYSNVITSLGGLAHPFRVEVAAMRSAVDARTQARLTEQLQGMSADERAEHGFVEDDSVEWDAGKVLHGPMRALPLNYALADELGEGSFSRRPTSRSSADTGSLAGSRPPSRPAMGLRPGTSGSGGGGSQAQLSSIGHAEASAVAGALPEE